MARPRRYVLYAYRSRGELRLGMPGVVTLDSLRQKTFPAPLTASRKGGTAAFGSHARTKAVLTFASPF